jgi:glycosyltransferase involved in cell wall biosynthesis
LSSARLAIITTHPIQYYAPVFHALERSAAIQPRVFYTWSQTADTQVADPGFGRLVSWDIPLLTGYEFEFVPNLARRPGPLHFRGIVNPGLIPAIEAWRADAVLVFGWSCESHLRALRHFKGRLPVLFRGDSNLLDSPSGWRRLARRAVLTWVYSHIDVAIAVGSNNHDYYRWCGLPEARVLFAPHAIDVQRFSDPHGAHAERAARWRQELGLTEDARVILFAGKMQAKKDPLLLLESFLAAGLPGELVLAGSGELEGPLRARAHGQRNVHFLPFQNQLAMPAVYRLADVFVLPSRGPGETWGLALNEAMACGRAVIAGSRVGGARDLVLPGTNGWVFESGSGAQLTSVIREALERDAQTLRAMGQAAQQLAARGSIEAAAAGIEAAVLRTVAERGRGSGPDRSPDEEQSTSSGYSA